MEEPERFSMATGEPVKETIEKYELKSIEQELFETIQKHRDARENNKEGNQT